jgi:putative endonuclease
VRPLAGGLLPGWGVSHDRIALGKTGEDLACRELERRGYAILARRYRCRGGELDIIARDGETLVFVEVKTRDGREFGEGVEAVTALKRRRITQVALDYVARHGSMDRPCRFDVVSIQSGTSGSTIEVFHSAFDASS